jgi:hypothetical protein
MGNLSGFRLVFEMADPMVDLMGSTSELQRDWSKVHAKEGRTVEKWVTAWEETTPEDVH